ncbi:Gfo/Idh/MocA family oxidoreductase [Rothia sp. AR01]|uniref:Gfo/Idh/MocA family oxidoreductase n=1 Tax=Rothia santali TaxID=2949643 RepID=A0A9X2KHZ0_9MICC|nr:Gfo/Idh/MocA family oxidoreductase [Rothia santali]MCP3425678.1 Gfo/Idh/MocA family oxidoreductase [Rothia santali]
MTTTQHPDRPLAIGLLGASRIAELAVTEATRATGDLRYSVAARDPGRAAAFAREHGYERSHPDYAALIADPAVDLVYIGLPNGLHAEWAARALEAGRDVLVEKPVAANLEEFDRLAAYVREPGPRLWEAFHYAWHPVMRRVLEIVGSGELGPLREVEIRMLMQEPGPEDPRWSFDLAGGALMDVGCYALHAAVLLGERLGLDLELQGARGVGSPADPRVDAEVEAELRLGGVPVGIRASMVAPEWDFSLRVAGERGEVLAPSYVLPGEDDAVVVTGGAGDRTERPGGGSSYAHQLRGIGGMLRRGDGCGEGLARSRRVMGLIDGVYRAAGFPLRPGRLGTSS